MNRETKIAISKLYKSYNKADSMETWLMVDQMYPDRDLTTEQLTPLTKEEERHRRIGALTALARLSEMLKINPY